MRASALHTYCLSYSLCVQDVGDYTVSLDPQEWGEAATNTYDNAKDDFLARMPKMPTEGTSLLGSKKE